MARSAAKALLWKDARERALVLAIMLLLPLVAGVCVGSIYRLATALFAAISGALVSALLIGATLTSDEDAAGGLAFERNLPVSALAIWLSRYGLGLAASAVVVFPTAVVVYCLGTEKLLHARPAEYAAATWLVYATGAYFTCAVRTNMAAVLLGLMSGAAFCGVAPLWNHERWMWTSWGIAVHQFVWAAALLSVGSALAFALRARRGELGVWSRTTLVVVGLLITGIGASAEGLILLADWHRLDSSDIGSLGIFPSPNGRHVWIMSPTSRKYRRSRLLVHRHVNLLYDVQSGKLIRTGITDGLSCYGWSPDGNRLLTVDDSSCEQVWELGAEGLCRGHRLEPGNSVCAWLTDTELLCRRYDSGGRPKHEWSVLDVTTGQRKRAFGDERHLRYLAGAPSSCAFQYYGTTADSAGPGSPTLVIVDLRDGTRRDVGLPPGQTPLHNASPDGRYLLLATRRNAREPFFEQLSLYDLRTGEVRPVLPESADRAREGWRTEWRHAWFSKDSRWLAALLTCEKTKRRLDVMEVVDLRSGKARVVSDLGRWFSGSRFSPDSSQLCYWHGRHGPIEVFSLPPEPDAPDLKIDPPVPTSRLRTAWIDSSKLIMAFRLHDNPKDQSTPRLLRKLARRNSWTLWVVDLQTRSIEMIWPRKWRHPSWRVQAHKEQRS